MEAQPYSNMSDIALMALCAYREARGEPLATKLAVCHVVQNRAKKPGWWGINTQSVILRPWQFSSFNDGDPNSDVWPGDINDRAWTDSLSAASAVLYGSDPDPTDGATYYHDSSIRFPSAWGSESDYIKTLTVGRLTFYRPI
jgi:cell wall hydrolase